MKHFEELMDLESALITIETHVALLDGFVQGVESVDQVTMVNGLHGITSILRADSNQLNKTFDQLFSAVREDDNEKPKNSKRKK